MTVLSIRNLNVSFATENGKFHALKDIAFDVPEKTIVGIVGESGCGKSTLINSILGLLADNGRIDGGSIAFEGQELTTLDKTAMRALRGPRISCVFQDPMGALNPVLSVGLQMVNIQYRSSQSKAEKEARAVEMLDQVRIPDPKDALDRFPHEFSGGMKQRIAIAMALLMRPGLLIADEPTTALDATLEVVTLELLKDLQEQIGCSVLFISHHLGVIAELCDEVAVMYAGEVVERGSTEEVFERPSHDYTRRLLECDPANQRERTRRLPTMSDEPGSFVPQPVPPLPERRPDEAPLLEVRDAVVTFKTGSLFKRKVVSGVAGVSFDLYPGETIGLVGESGSGKTTLARASARLQDISGGSIRFEGQSVHDLGAVAMQRLRRDISMMFQDPQGSLSPRMTVFDLVAEPFRIHDVTNVDLKEETARLLSLVGLGPEFSGRFPHQLSGGQARRVGVARAIALGPKLIIADEPTAGLDVSVQGGVLNLLNDLREELNLAMIFITHNLNVVRHVADRMMVMYHGEFVEFGDAEDIFSAPQHPYTKKLLSANLAGPGRPQ
ncbi:MAG: ABC transporter ATP-binding protein [Pseudomonadota bacterium]